MFMRFSGSVFSVSEHFRSTFGAVWDPIELASISFDLILMLNDLQLLRYTSTARSWWIFISWGVNLIKIGSYCVPNCDFCRWHFSSSFSDCGSALFYRYRWELVFRVVCQRLYLSAVAIQINWMGVVVVLLFLGRRRWRLSGVSFLFLCCWAALTNNRIRTRFQSNINVIL